LVECAQHIPFGEKRSPHYPIVCTQFQGIPLIRYAIYEKEIDSSVFQLRLSICLHTSSDCIIHMGTQNTLELTIVTMTEIETTIQFGASETCLSGH
jgi:hypothetical protein